MPGNAPPVVGRVSDVADVGEFVEQGQRSASIAWERLKIALGRSARIGDPHDALDRIDPSSQLLVLCHGNICRSPVAERLLSRRLRERGFDDMSVSSAGFTDAEGEPSPETAVTAAAAYGVDLAGHRATAVDRELAAGSDLILLMDANNYRLLRRRYGEYRGKACFLGSFDGALDDEIQDPYAGTIDEFQRVYDRIDDAVDGFVERIADRYR